MLEDSEIPESVKRMFEEAREIRRKYANWEFINKQSEPIKSALTYYVKRGDMRLTAKLAGLELDEFLDLAFKAKIPTVT